MKQQLGHYNIVAELGRGGMGVVYKGFEPALHRYVAIKVLADSLAHDESVKERFLREARSMAALNDPHIIQIYFIGEDDGQPYFVMEFVEGESLSNVLKREGKISSEQAARIIFQTAQGLSSAHDKGVIHRDIKPGNLMLTSKGAIKVADFGIALVAQDFSKKLTSTGEFVGTPGYLSPEVCLGKPVDQRSDIFSLGVVLFEMLTGRMPFTDESPLGLMLEVVRAEIPDVRQLNQEVDPTIARILAKMIAKDPAERYQSCQELVTELGQHPLVANGAPITLNTKISTAAATVMGLKTPFSSQHPLSNAATITTATTRITPAHQPVLGRQEFPRKRSAVLPWAIAATLLMGIGGGAYAFRDRIPYLNSLGNTNVVTSLTTTIATPPLVQTPPASTIAVAVPTGNTAGVMPDSTAAVANNVVSLDSVPAPASSLASAPATQESAQNTVAANPTSVTDIASTATPSEVATASDGPASRASRVELLHDLAAARAAESTPSVGAVVARNTQSKPISDPVKPHIPTIAVIASGDAAVSHPAEQLIEETLARNGFNLVDQSTLPRVTQIMRGENPDFGSVLRSLARNGQVDVVVFVHARPVGTQEIAYYGQVSTLYTVQLAVKAYHIPEQRMLGPGWSEQINFTSLNADEKAREAIEPLMSEVTDKLADYRVRNGQNRG